MLDNECLRFENDTVIIGKEFFNKGPMIKRKNTKVTRIFIDMVRDVYNNLDPKDHYKLGIILQLIPYINPYFNCLAKNPAETCKENLIPLKLGELTEILGYSSQHCRRVGNEIISTRFGSEKKRIMATAYHPKGKDAICFKNITFREKTKSNPYATRKVLWRRYGSQAVA